MYPSHLRTGKRGYFANRESEKDSRHKRKTDPRSDVIVRAWVHLAQSPALRSNPELTVSVITENQTKAREELIHPRLRFCTHALYQAPPMLAPTIKVK